MTDSYHRNRARGMCGHCGKVPPELGKKNCRRCLDKINLSAKVRAAKAIAEGKCPTCQRAGYFPRGRKGQQLVFPFGAAA